MAFLPAIGGIVSGLGSLFGGRRESRAVANAARQAPQFLEQSFVGQTLLPQAGQAADLRGALLGLGGDEAAANAAFDRFLQSTGFQGELETGSRAITGNRAARGLLGSGRTGAALQEFGQQLGRRGFQDFLGQLGGVTGQGLQGAGQIAAAQAAAVPGIQSAEASRRRGLGGLFGGIGQALGGLFG